MWLIKETWFHFTFSATLITELFIIISEIFITSHGWSFSLSRKHQMTSLYYIMLFLVFSEWELSVFSSNIEGSGPVFSLQQPQIYSVDRANTFLSGPVKKTNILTTNTPSINSCVLHTRASLLGHDSYRRISGNQ